MLKIILISLAVFVAVFVIIVVLQPAEFRVTRSATMPASPDAVFAQVNELRKWEAWSPWAKLDPDAKSSFEGPAAGEGAVMHWDGNREVGKGSMTITESRPHELIRFRLDFLKPMQATSTTEFTFQPEGEQTVVTWSMFGENNFIAKAMSLFMDCEKMVGDQFEQGLANMKTAVASAHSQ